MEDEATFLRAMALRYVWVHGEPAASAFPDRTIRRVMDFGTIEDVLAMESVLGRDRLVAVLRSSPAGGLRPRSWWFWHYRLGLTQGADDPPAMPARVVPPRRRGCAKASYFKCGLSN